MDGGLKKEYRGVKITAHIFMIVFTVLAVLPFLMLISSSITSNESLATHGANFFPRVFDFEAYGYIAKSWDVIGRSYIITIFTTLVGTVASLLISTMLAYGLAWHKTPGRRIIKFMIVFALLFNGGAVSSYIVYTQLFNMTNSILAYIVPNLLMNGFTVILYINYFKNVIPSSLMEAAQIDGANMFTIYHKIFIPLSLPIIATMGMSTLIVYWNDWNNGLYYISELDKYSVQLLLTKLQEDVNNLASMTGYDKDASLPTESLRMAIAVIGILPMLLIYPFFQKYFAGGIALGGVKE